MLFRSPAGVFITTIQKFRELGEIKDERGNVVVLIDEAHRTEYGDYQMELRAVLPNAKRFAFTGTPIPKTHREFGIKGEDGKIEYYLDKYSVIDAINDGATRPIKYTLGPSQWFLDKENLKKGYEEITAELEESEKRLVEKAVQPWKRLMKDERRIEVLAEDIAKDFKERLEPQGFKAQVVAIDKEACVSRRIASSTTVVVARSFGSSMTAGLWLPGVASTWPGIRKRCTISCRSCMPAMA